MDFDELSLLPKTDDGNDNGGGAKPVVSIGTTNSGGTRSDASASGGSGTERDDTVSDGSRGDENSTIVGPGGTAADTRRNDPYRARSGSGRSGRKRSDRGNSRASTATSGRASATESEAQPDSEAVPRHVEPKELGARIGAAKAGALTQEFLAEGWVLAFDAVGFLMRDKEWHIDKDGDAAELAERTLNWVRSLDKKKSAELEKKIAKWQPMLSILMALIAIVGPRLAHTRSLRRAINLQKKGADTSATESASSAPVVNSDVLRQSSNGRPDGNGQPNASVRPFRRADFGEIFGVNDG